MIQIRKIECGKHAADINIKNEPFPLFGRMIPSLCDGVWDYRVERFVQEGQMCFPDFPYDINDADATYLGAYDGDDCIGLAVVRTKLFRFLYLDDLKVRRAYRGRGVGRMLIGACMDVAQEKGLRGVYTIAQDNNLAACLFYLGVGFEIGGFDNRTYGGTTQEGKGDIYFYKDL